VDESLPVPKEIVTSVLPSDHLPLEELLTNIRGSKVKIKVAERGDKRALTETAMTNAVSSLTQFKLKRSTDFTARSVALANLQSALGLSSIPLVIECYDVSHLAGTNIVASKVVFVDGKPRKDLYRRYNIATANDDTDAMNQVLIRRLAALDSDDELPDLIVVDGARPQVSAALKAARSVGVEGLNLVGIAKRLENYGYRRMTFQYSFLELATSCFSSSTSGMNLTDSQLRIKGKNAVPTSPPRSKKFLDWERREPGYFSKLLVPLRELSWPVFQS
jgi:excinuclease UvrABC nuclease subunit